MSGAITAAVVVAAGSAYASKKASDAQKKAARAQAQGIENAQGISAEAAAKARADAMALFNPAFADISNSLNQSRHDILSGRVSAQNILNNAFLQSSDTLQTSGQQAMKAILGGPGAASSAPLFEQPAGIPSYRQPQPIVEQPQMQDAQQQGLPAEPQMPLDANQPPWFDMPIQQPNAPVQPQQPSWMLSQPQQPSWMSTYPESVQGEITSGLRAGAGATQGVASGAGNPYQDRGNRLRGSGGSTITDLLDRELYRNQY